MKKETEKSLKTKNLIYETAISLFQSEGFDKATMREISKKAEVSLGLTYYHFKSKEEIVFHFYEKTQEESYSLNLKYCEKERDFKKRIINILTTKIEQFDPYSNFLHVLARTAVDPKSPLSPFSTETSNIRKNAVEIFQHAITSSNYKPPEDLKIALPAILWMYQMSIIYFWILDKSKGKEKTYTLIEVSFDLIFKLLRISRLPFMKPIRKTILKLYSFILGSVN
ncbi:MAG: TetR family transcriptional regulator [Leptospiraceae bacterium]|nr:TetR family transcriptional regulator [Leptospiraceae bacterium]